MKHLAVALALFGLAFALPCRAIPIPVGTTPSDDLIFNFVLPPSGPYTGIFATYLLDAEQYVIWDLFPGLNGSGGVAFSSNLFAAGGTLANLQDVAGFEDGQFSIGFRLSFGTADMTSLIGGANNAAGALVTATVTAVTIPEPGTLALLSLGLFGLALRRRKTQ